MVGVAANLAAVVIASPLHARSAASAEPSRSCSEATAEPSTHTIDIEGVGRQYRLAMPEPQKGKRLRPLVLNFHGFGRNDVTQAEYSELEEKGPARGFVVITPNAGDPPFWDNRLTEPGLAISHMSDANLAFTTSLIDSAVAELCVDPKRVYATGFSNGAGAATYLGCRLSRRIAAIAPVSGVNLAEPCPRGKPMPVVAFHGTADPEVWYQGGPRPSPQRPNLNSPSVEAAVHAWAQRAKCASTPARKSVGAAVERIAYRDCARGADVLLYKVHDGAHNWPGSYELDVLGLPTQDINAADLILGFFAHH
jgi:polyhydroxybutyrate depolymerase